MHKKELETLLKSYDEMETISINHDIKYLEEILARIHQQPVEMYKSDILTADILMKNTEKISFMKHPRFVEIKKHKHDYLEMSYAFRGNFTQVINDQVVEMSEGDLTILDTDVVHSINRVDKDTIIINILLRKDYFNQYILSHLAENDLISEFVIDAIYRPNITGRYLYFPAHGNNKVRHYISTAMCEYLDPDLASVEVVNCNIILLFTELLRISRRNKLQVNDEMPIKTSFVEILKYIEENYLTATLTEVAIRFHFHPNYLSRILKENLGKTFSDMIQELRLRQAKLLLENTELQINRIAEEVGYSNFHHFYKKFKEYYHVTPAEYRKQIKD
ncbi:AraC family transcriptional regulator [Neobacillus sp. Marseille-QA0830]